MLIAASKGPYRRTLIMGERPRGSVRLFGTNGIREVVGDRLTAPFVTSVAEGIARAYPVGRPIVVGWDGRTSSPAFAHLVSSVLSLAGHRVIEVGVMPTPAVQFNVLRLGAQCGVILTASHNPPDFNGVKLIAGDGLEAEREKEEEVERAVAEGVGRFAPFDQVGSVTTDHAGASAYVHRILELVDRESIRRRKFRVVLDCGNGASVPTSPALLRELGCQVVTLNGHVDGTFPGHLSEPTEANLADLIRTVPAVQADLGIAHDGDADRAVFVDASGRYVPGEKILTWLAREFVRERGGGVVVTPVSGSQSLVDAVQPFGGEVVFTRVGSPSVTHEMQARSAVFGGEENGGLIFPKLQLARDGAMTAASVLDRLARSGASLADALADLPEYTLVKRKVACDPKLRDAVIGSLAEELGRSAVKIDRIDGLKVFFADGWVLLRPSGTEPLLRIFAEAKRMERATEIADGVERDVAAALVRLGSPRK